MTYLKKAVIFGFQILVDAMSILYIDKQLIDTIWRLNDQLINFPIGAK